MPINFGNNEQEPLDLSKGGDQGVTSNSGTPRPPLPTPLPARPVVPSAPAIPARQPVVVPQPQQPVQQPQPVQPIQQPVPQQSNWQPPQQQVPAQQMPVQQVPVQQQQPVFTNPANESSQSPNYSTPMELNIQRSGRQGGSTDVAPRQPEPQVVMVDRKGRPIVQKEKKKPTPPAKKGTFTGDRNKVLVARIVIFGIIGALVIAGLVSFVPKKTALNESTDRSTILSWVRSGIGVTAFPSELGKSYALAFTEAYLTYDPAHKENRTKALSQFVSDKLLDSIDFHPATANDLKEANAPVSTTPTNNGSQPSPTSTPTPEPTPTSTPAPTPTATSVPQGGGSSTSTTPVIPPTGVPTFPVDETGNLVVSQYIVGGPYIVQVVDLGAGRDKYDDGTPIGVDALITTMSQLNNGEWVYLQIPIHYNYPTGQNPANSNYVPNLGTMTVSGIPTFAAPIASDDKVNSLATTPSWSGKTDDALSDQLRNSRIVPFFQSWLASDTTTLQNYYVKKDSGQPATFLPTPAVSDGLNGQFKLVALTDFQIQKIDNNADTPESEQLPTNDRQAIAAVTLYDPQTGFVYQQSFLIHMVEDSANNWYVQNIQNIAMGITPNVVNLAPNGG